MKTNKEKRESAQLVRANLKSLTMALKTAAAMGQIPDGSPNVLLKMYYAQKGHKDLKTWMQWRDAGYSVKKGEKALHLWSSPKTFTRKPRTTPEGMEAPENVEPGMLEAAAQPETYDAYSYITLFSRAQVEKITEREARRTAAKKAAPAVIPVTVTAAPATATADNDLLPF